MADIDLAALGQQIQATAERVKDADPAALRARIAVLERDLAAALARQPDPVRVEVPILDPDTVERLTVALKPAVDLLAEVQQALAVPIAAAAPAAPRARAEPPEPLVRPPDPGPDVDGRRLGKAERAILSALAQHGTRTVTQAALLTGYSSKSGGVPQCAVLAEVCRVYRGPRGSHCNARRTGRPRRLRAPALRPSAD
jgi:hypothetical protein